MSQHGGGSVATLEVVGLSAWPCQAAPLATLSPLPRCHTLLPLSLLQVVLHVEHLLMMAHDHDSQPSTHGGSFQERPCAPANAAEAYVWGVRLAVREGGCCASRAAFVGACLGAAAGAQALPASWVDACGAAADVRRWAGAICDAR